MPCDHLNRQQLPSNEDLEYAYSKLLELCTEHKICAHCATIAGLKIFIQAALVGKGMTLEEMHNMLDQMHAAVTSALRTGSFDIRRAKVQGAPS
jgi:hypothetical protein